MLYLFVPMLRNFWPTVKGLYGKGMDNQFSIRRSLMTSNSSLWQRSIKYYLAASTLQSLLIYVVVLLKEVSQYCDTHISTNPKQLLARRGLSITPQISLVLAILYCCCSVAQDTEHVEPTVFDIPLTIIIPTSYQFHHVPSSPPPPLSRSSSCEPRTVGRMEREAFRTPSQRAKMQQAQCT